MTIIEVLRLFLGYEGNLQEKVRLNLETMVLGFLQDVVFVTLSYINFRPTVIQYFYELLQQQGFEELYQMTSWAQLM